MFRVHVNQQPVGAAFPTRETASAQLLDALRQGERSGIVAGAFDTVTIRSVPAAQPSFAQAASPPA